MNSIVNTDISDSGKQKDLVEHLKSDDFFAVADHSTAKIVFSDISKKDDDKYEIKGDFTVRGITKPITFTAELEQEGDMLEGESELSFDRAKHNVKYNSGSFFEKLGDKLIHDKIQLDIKIAAKK
jgi:polyisoprenoid-binding protein YceI